MAIQQMQQNNQVSSQQRVQNGGRSPTYDGRGQNGWQPNRMGDGNTDQLARALGWFSIGLGLAQIAAPRAVAQLIGISADRENQSVLRAVGVREIASGIGILTTSNPAGWVRARVGGDVMDMALLGGALSSDRAEQDRVALAMVAVAGVAAVDMFCTQQLEQQSEDQQLYNQQPYNQQWNNQQSGRQQMSDQPFSSGTRAASMPKDGGIHVKKYITINRSPEELYQFWHNFENLPRFMHHLEAVQVQGDRRSHWRAKAPAGMTVEWDAEITEDQANELIAWQALEGADIPNTGSVRFKPAPGNRGTVVTVELHYDAPGGKIGAAIAKLFGEEPEQQVQDDLRAFKQVMETGEVVRSDGSLWGPRLTQRPAQPPTDEELMSNSERTTV